MRGRPTGIRNEFWISVRKIEPERGDIFGDEAGIFGDEAGIRRTEVEVREQDSGRERQGFETDTDRPQVVVLEGNVAGSQGFELGARPVSNRVMARYFWF
jgi:hypothetical protein